MYVHNLIVSFVLQRFTLTSKCCCADGCNMTSPKSNNNGKSKKQPDPGIVGIVLLSMYVYIDACTYCMYSNINGLVYIHMKYIVHTEYTL